MPTRNAASAKNTQQQNGKMPKINDGDWVRPNMNGFLLGCCDCGLTHKLLFRIVEGAVEFQIFRDHEATRRCRGM